MTLSTDDVIAIEQLYARYNHAIDFGDAEGWADLFTRDGTFTFPGLDTIEGRDALRAFAAGVPGGLRHWIGNLVLDESPDGATGRCYLTAFAVTGEDTPKAALTGQYTDQLARTDDSGWRFASRSVTLDA